MKIAPKPERETDRLAALEGFGVLDTPPDPILDSITQAAANLCETPIALISLIDPTRQWFKSCVGMDLRETSRDVSLCSHAILNPTALTEVEDTALDDRFHDNPLVTGEPKIRFYAGQPLVTPDGFALGTLCVLDRKPRKTTSSQRAALANLAEAAMKWIAERQQSPIDVIGRAFEDTNHVSIAICDAKQPDHPITHCNHGFEILTGYSKDEILGKNCRFLQGHDTDSADVARLREAIAEGRAVTVTIENYRKNGSAFWNELQVTPIRNPAGAVTHFLGIQNDVSSRRQAEARVAGLGDVVEASINEVFMFDETSLRFVHVNRGARRNLGYTMEELHKLTPVDIKPEFTREAFEAAIKPLRTNEKSKIDFLTAHQRKDGSTYPVEVHLQRSHFDSRPVFAAIILDITERTQTEEALAQARLFLESAPDATVIVNRSGEIEVANSRTTTLFGYTPDELRGMPIEVLVPRRFRNQHVTHREHFVADPKVRGMGADLDLFAVTKSGGEIPIEVSLSPIQTGDGMLVAAAVRDVSQRVKDAQALQAAKETAEIATATKSRFLAAASHDLRQPLQSIGLYLSVLNRNLEKPNNQDISEKIRNSVDVMGELLDALLDISKLDSGSVTPARKDFAIQTMFDQMLASSGPHASEKGLTFRCETTSCVVHSDPALLQRVVENFVSNAIRYTDSGSVEVRCRNCDDHARIEVKDTGAGIPDDAIETIFEEYFQLDNSVRDRGKGLGLGLSIVKHIARLLEHPLNVTSVLGEGSTFSVDVPLGQAMEQTVEATQPVTRQPQTERDRVVLLVDDDPAIVDATTLLLDVSGYKVYSAHNGDEALAHLTSGVRPDIVVSDYRLPGENGIEVMQRVRKATVDDLPTVLMTGDTSSQEIEAAGLAHCTVLHKPVDSEQLISLIESLTA